MKKVIGLFIMIMTCFLISGCNNLKVPAGENKTEFYLNQEATIDHFKITLNDIVETQNFQDVHPEKDTYLVLELKITNISNEEQTISSDKNFKLMINDKAYTDLNHNKDTVIAPNESVMYQVIYDVPEEDSYSLLFYSGVVTNNIKFITK